MAEMELAATAMASEKTKSPVTADVCISTPTGTRTLQVWQTLLSWLGVLFKILAQFLKGTPSIPHLHYSFLFPSSPSPSFKPLPVDELPPSPPATASVVSNQPPFEKLTIVLDLDETLVCAYETSCLPDSVRACAIDAGVNCFELECFSSEKDEKGNPKVSHVTVFERPGLREFLQGISDFGNLVLFTAGLEGYARPLVDRIDVDNKFSLRLYRPSTVATEYRDHVKDLSCISGNFDRIVIVDNNPFSFLLQPLNGIPCVPFSAGQPHDEQLNGVLLPLLKHLSLQKDVRPLLYERFHMPEWFKHHGIPTST